MPEPLSTIAALLATAKKLREVAQKVKDAEIKGLIADLNLQLADLKMQVAEFQEENHELRTKLKAREDLSELRSKMELVDDVYFLRGDSGEQPGPYCVHCFDAKKELVRVKKETGPFTAAGKYYCPSCRTHFGAGDL